MRESFGKRLELFRLAAGLSTWQVEKQTGIDRRNLRAIEKDKRSASPEILESLSKCYSISLDWLVALKIISKFTPEQLKFAKKELCN